MLQPRTNNAPPTSSTEHGSAARCVALRLSLPSSTACLSRTLMMRLGSCAAWAAAICALLAANKRWVASPLSCCSPCRETSRERRSSLKTCLDRDTKISPTKQSMREGQHAAKTGQLPHRFSKPPLVSICCLFCPTPAKVVSQVALTYLRLAAHLTTLQKRSRSASKGALFPPNHPLTPFRPAQLERLTHKVDQDDARHDGKPPGQALQSRPDRAAESAPFLVTSGLSLQQRWLSL